MADATDPVAEILQGISRAAARLDHLSAYDRADRATRDHPAELGLEYAAILALANTGATAGADRRLAALHASGRLDTVTPLSRRFAALRGRLLKDRALAADPSDRAGLAAEATDAYEAADALYGGNSYPAINAAATSVLAGDRARAARHARAARERAAGEAADYWTAATQAEAALILGDIAEANAAYARAGALAAGDLNAIATTRRQLRWLAAALGIPPAVVPGPPPPAILYWVADRDGSAEEAEALAAATRRLIADAPGAIALGALLGPADTAIATRLLDAGCAVEFVLPCATDTCRTILGGWAGADAAADFDTVLARASDTARVTWEGDPGEATLVGLSLQQARGTALLRGTRFDAPVYRALLRAGGGVSVAIDDGRRDGRLDALVWGYPPSPGQRLTRALVFGDVRGFSQLNEAAQLAFIRHVIGGFADALAGFGAAIDYAETAGDGIYVVFDHVAAAARCCDALHDVVAPARLAAAGLPPHLGLRLSAHVGPVFRALDRVIGRERFCGQEVIRTARMEPVTPVGETYVTEQFAAALICAAARDWTCDYVGIQPMAKGFGDCRMYALRPMNASPSGARPVAAP
jgi:hypothetical protein